MILLAGTAVIALAVVAVARRADVRLVLGLAALALGVLAGKPQVVLRTFLATLSSEQFVIPICSAMGFAYVLRLTGCDQHLVRLLVEPFRRVRPLLIPGTVLIGFLVNVPIVSQSSTVVTVGPVLIPLLRAAGVSPVSTGAALVLGASIGGELLNPGAPELQTVSRAVSETGERQLTPQDCVEYVTRPLLLHLAVTTGLFWLVSVRADRRAGVTAAAPDAPPPGKGARPGPAPPGERQAEPGPDGFRVNPVKALVPLVPIVLLFLTGPKVGPVGGLRVPADWLVGPDEPAKLASTRLIGAAMLVGVVVAALVGGRASAGAGRAFFEGAGYAYTHIVAIIVCAYAFGKGVELIGLDQVLDRAIGRRPGLLFPSAVGLPLGFAWVCGSGFASTQSLFAFFVPPARDLGVDPAAVGALVSIGAAAGRTMSPVAAVVLMCASMTGTAPWDLVRRVALPLAGGLAAVLLLRGLLAG
jgi:DcuC family C4-dicarboxylate transporter